MIIAALNESANDSRVAITPNTIKHYKKVGIEVRCEERAGERAGFTDDDYRQLGATITCNHQTLVNQANIIVFINQPLIAQLEHLSAHSLIIAPIDKETSELITWCCEKEISLFSMNLIPRISRAQSMDSLSSQANLAGYRAVLEAVNHFNRAIPMMMTAAGMIHPAKCLILGAGVAGLQAIATAKRLGAIVYAFDVRQVAKEQVESLGAEFISVDDTDYETTSGYASEMTADYQTRQAALIDNYARLSDIIICTALIPGQKAPILINAETVLQMKKGSVIVDLATSRGGNCTLSQKDHVINHHGVTLIGYSNMVGLVPATASELYAGNVVNLVRHLISSDTLNFDPADDIVKQGLLCHNGQYCPYENLKEA